MAKPGINAPVDSRNIDKLSKRVKKDLLWLLVSLAVATAAAVAVYMVLPG